MTSCESLGYRTTSAEDVIRLRELTVELRPYQKQSVRWAVDQEKRPGGIMSHLYAGLWTSGQGQCTHSPFLGETRTEPSRADVRGGFVCEEMGMARRSLHSAWLCNPPLCQQGRLRRLLQLYHGGRRGAGAEPRHAGRVSGVLVGQWVSEARSKIKDGSKLKIHEYYGQKRIRDPKKLAEFDLVVSTYETLSSDLRMFMHPTQKQLQRVERPPCLPARKSTGTACHG